MNSKLYYAVATLSSTTGRVIRILGLIDGTIDQYAARNQARTLISSTEDSGLFKAIVSVIDGSVTLRQRLAVLGPVTFGEWIDDEWWA